MSKRKMGSAASRGLCKVRWDQDCSAGGELELQHECHRKKDHIGACKCYFCGETRGIVINEKLLKYDNGATRIPVPEHFHYVCPELERRVAAICAEGHKSYPDKSVEYAELSTGRLGLPVANLSKHARRHWNLYWRGDRTEDHLAKVAWAIAELMHKESLETGKPCQHFNILVKPEHQTDPKPKRIK